MAEPTPEQQLIINAATSAAETLLKKLEKHESKVQRKYDYYNADNHTRDYGIAMPNQMKNIKPGVGWIGRAVNILSDRVIFDGFANDNFSINDLFASINAGPVINQSKHDAFIAGCAFVAIGDNPDPESNGKILIPFTAAEATGVVDTKTGLLKTGVAVTRWAYPTDGRRRKVLSAEDYIIFAPSYTATFANRKLAQVFPNPTGRPLLHPIATRQSADRPLGKARVTNTARRIVNEVVRVKRRYEVAGEFYSIPQRYIVGLADGAKKDDKLDSAIGRVWTITKDEDGDSPEVGQLTQMNIDQFSSAKKDLARDFCAETALTLRNLGYESGNPSSAESLEALSDDLILEAETAQNTMGEQIKQIAITLRLALDQNNVIPAELNNLKPAWKPIFRVDAGAVGDAVYKLTQVMPELLGNPKLYQMLGIGIREAEQLSQERSKLKVAGFMTQGGGNG